MRRTPEHLRISAGGSLAHRGHCRWRSCEKAFADSSQQAPAVAVYGSHLSDRARIETSFTVPLSFSRDGASRQGYDRRRAAHFALRINGLAWNVSQQRRHKVFVGSAAL